MAPNVPVKSEALKKEAATLSKIIKRFALTSVKLLARYGEDIVERQLQLDRLSSTVIAIYTTTAVISKLDWELTHDVGDPEKLAKDLEIGKFYCQHAMRQADRLLNGTGKNNDDQIENLSDLITGLKKS